MWRLKNKIYTLFHDPGKVGLYLLPYYRSMLSDRKHIELYYKYSMGEKLNLDTPQTFNEKLQWLKIHDRKPVYTTMVDKYEAKKWAAGIIGEEHIIPTIGVWDRFEDIDFTTLPEQFVLKTTHDGGGSCVIVCKDRQKFDVEATRKKVKRSMGESAWEKHREWPYKNVKRRIIVEQYMEDGQSGTLPDYKIHNFNGEPRFILICQDRFEKTGMTEDFYTPEWEHMDVARPQHPNAKSLTPRPDELGEMLRLARTLSKDIPFVRSDFYIINHKIFFGEMTFFPASGVKHFVPDSWDDVFGSWLKLPEQTEQ